jgi:hypothetical protein
VSYVHPNNRDLGILLRFDRRARLLCRCPDPTFGNSPLGESILVHFTGGYYDVLPSCKIVEGKYVYHYPTVKELSEKSRIVDVYLDDVLIHSQECTHDCKLSFSLPDQIRTGSHDLDIRPRSWGYYPRDVTFNIMILR